METDNVATTTSNKGKKNINWTWLILGVLGLGAMYMISKKMKSSTPTTTTNNGGTDPSAGGSTTTARNTEDYKLGYWAWKIKKTKEWAQATANKARIAKKAINEQLYVDAQLKVTNGDATGEDFSTFVAMVDARLAADKSTVSDSIKFNNAMQYVVAAQPWVAMIQPAPTTPAASSAATSLTGTVIL